MDRYIMYFLFLFLGIFAAEAAFVISSTLQEPTGVESNTIDLGLPLEQPPKTPVRSTRRGLFSKMFRSGDLNVEKHDTVDPGEPLFLTPYLESGKVAEARSLSRVRMGHRYGHSFSGFFTVNKKYNSNLFFWFFPARVNAPKAPVVIWLQGGPGGSSLFGLFAEHGPFTINENMQLVPRNYSWNNNHNVLYIDNPVGTGFSFTDSDAGYARNEIDVGRDLYASLLQFYQLFPGLKDNELFITGESYAGKYVPALAYTIHKNNPAAKMKMNLKGVAIGDGLCDPITMTNYGDYLYQIGLLDLNGRKVFKGQSDLAVKYIQQKQWRKAFQVFDTLLNGDTIDVKSYFYNYTGFTNYYNFLLTKEPKELGYWESFVNQGKVRSEIHVGNLTFHDGKKVEEFLEEDVMKSVKPWIEELLKSEKYLVLIYSGQLDIIIASPLTDNFVNSLDFQYADKWKAAPRYIWKVDGEVAGYVKEVPNMSQVLIRNAGHMVPYDQPKWAFEMISRFTGGKGMRDVEN